MCSSLRSAYVTWSCGSATTSAGTPVWDLRYAETPLFLLECLNLVRCAVISFFKSPSPGTHSPALQRPSCKTCWAAEKSGWAPARGHQPLCLVVFWAGRLPNTLHHSSADLCLKATPNTHQPTTTLWPHKVHRPVCHYADWPHRCTNPRWHYLHLSQVVTSE